MKHWMIMAAFAALACCATPASAQQSDAAAAKKAEKAAKKAKKQTAKTAKNALQQPVAAPVLTNEADSAAYYFGLAQSRGLKAYMQQQLGVDTAYIDAFTRGIMERAAIDPADKEQHAYHAGMTIGGQVENMAQSLAKDYYAAAPGQTIDTRIVAAALIEGLTEKGSISTDSAQVAYRNIMTRRQAENQEALYGENRRKGEEFLAANRTAEGVVTLPSGLQYKVLQQGDGAVPTATQKVKVNYEGHLVDGTEFDSSYRRGEPATFQVNQVIKGWTEALCLMPAGSKWQLFIPQELGYGERAAGKIPPFSTLIFTVELLSVEE